MKKTLFFASVFSGLLVSLPAVSYPVFGILLGAYCRSVESGICFYDDTSSVYTSLSPALSRNNGYITNNKVYLNTSAKENEYIVVNIIRGDNSTTDAQLRKIFSVRAGYGRAYELARLIGGRVVRNYSNGKYFVEITSGSSTDTRNFLHAWMTYINGEPAIVTVGYGQDAFTDFLFRSAFVDRDRGNYFGVYQTYGRRYPNYL